MSDSTKKSYKELQKECDDFRHLQIILKNAHYYKEAPDDSEQKLAFELDQSTRDKVLNIIEKIKSFNPYV